MSKAGKFTKKSSEERGSSSRPPSDSPGSRRRSDSPKRQSARGRRVPLRRVETSLDADAGSCRGTGIGKGGLATWQSELWRRWESKTSDSAQIEATTGNHGKPDPHSRGKKGNEKPFREMALPSGKNRSSDAPGRADVGDMPTAETLGSLARHVLSRSRHAESRELARAVLRLLARSK